MKWLASLICAITQHRYVVEKRFTHYSRKIGCTRCGKQWAMNDDVRCLLPWDAELEVLYKDERFYK
jgi:hypothetical protein